MITIDPLYFLLFLEGLLIQAIVIFWLYLRGRKLKRAYQPASELGPHQSQKEKSSLGEAGASQVEGLEMGEDNQSSGSTKEESDKKILELAEIAPETEDLKKILDEKVEIILEMKKKIEGMEKKFADMENEYLILFDQSQKQEQALKAAGLSVNPDAVDF
jgi:hypothetical protein